MIWGLGLILAAVVAFACAIQFVVKVGFKKVSVSFMLLLASYAILSCASGLIILTLPGGDGFRGLILKWADKLLPLVGSITPFFILLTSRHYGRVDKKSYAPGVSAVSKLAGLIVAVVFVFLSQQLIYDTVITQSGYYLVLKGFVSRATTAAMGILLIISLLYFESTWRAASGQVKKQLFMLVVLNLLLLAAIIRIFFLGQISISFIGYFMPLLLFIFIRLYFLLIGQDAYSSNVVVDRQAFFSSAIILFVGIFLVFTGIIGIIIDKAGGRTDVFLSILGAFLVVGIFIFVLLSDSIRDRLSGALHSRVYAGRFDYKAEWRAISDDFAACDSIDNLVESLTDRLEHLFQPSRLAVYEAEGRLMKCVYSSDSKPGAFQASDPVVEWAFLKTKPAKTSEIEVTNDSLLLKLSREYEIIAPMVASKKLAGLVFLGKKDNSTEYNAEDMAMLSAVCHQAAVTISHLQSLERLLETEKLSSFHKTASFVVHDLKNAISMLSLLLQNAPRKMSDPMFQKESVRTTEQAVARMQQIIEKLKSPPSKDQLIIQAVDPMKVFHQALDKSGIANKTNIEINIDSAEPLLVKTDPGVLETVFSNLLINAVEAMPQGGIIAVKHRLVDKVIEISVTDSGIGMNESFMNNKLFRPFQTTKAKGLGIGLYQCREMIRETGGDLIAASVPDKGSTFTLKLPC